MTMAAITEHPELWALRGQHRRHRQLRDVPRAHGRLPPRAARGRVRLARARPRVPGVDLADPQDRSHRLPADGDPRRERPARARERGRAGRRGAARARRRPSSTCATRTRATASRACPTASTATRASPRSCRSTCRTCNACRMRFEADLEAARARIADAVVRTPVWRSDELDAALGAELFLKCEPLQRTGSFKLRGATNAIRSLPAGTRGVVAVSSGNHAQAVAYAGRAAGLPVTVVMNADASPAKRAATLALRRDGRVRGSRSHEPRGDRARPRRERGPRARASVRRLERDRRPGHCHARAARGRAGPGGGDHAGRWRRAALRRRARVSARRRPGPAPTAPSRRPRPMPSARSPRAAASAWNTRR